MFDLYLYPLVALFGGNTLLFIVCQTPLGKRDNSWIDAMWGISFVIPNVVLILMRDQVTWRMILITALETIWALRLSTYIFLRHRSEDWRYKEMR